MVSLKWIYPFKVFVSIVNYYTVLLFPSRIWSFKEKVLKLQLVFLFLLLLLLLHSAFQAFRNVCALSRRKYYNM